MSVKEFERLMLVPSADLTEGQQNFLTVHSEMVMAGQKAAECLLIVARDMQRMRDEELYKAAGFESFTEYVETALNIKERQAYNWISILKLPEEYLTKNAAMGVTKLALISSASEPVAEELMNDETTSKNSVKELRERIKGYEAQIAEQEKQLTLTEGDLQNREDRIRELEEELQERDNSDVDTLEYYKKIEDLEEQLKSANIELEIAKGKAGAAEKEIEKLVVEARPKVVTETVEKTVEVENPETLKALEEAQKNFEAAKADRENAEAEAKKYQDELKAYKKTQEAVAAFKIHAVSLFGAWDTVIEAVQEIHKSGETELAEKCLEKLKSFSETVAGDIEVVRQ